jgi:ATP-dependent DNA helicase RecG
LDKEALEKLIQGGETATVEFKVAVPRAAELAERICGFANSLGGLLVIGVVDKTWQVVGVKNTSETIDIILQAARLCKPTVQFDPPQLQVIDLYGKQLVLAYVPPNDGTLYQAGGVCWTRRGTYTVPLEVSEIEEFLYHRGTLAWETQPVLRATLEDLDMSLIEAYLAQRPDRSKINGRLAPLENVLLNIGCATTTGHDEKQVVRPTNAGMLLFGATPQQFLIQTEVVCVLYRDTLGMRRYADRRILQGTITRQIDQAEAFFKQYVPVAGYMEGFHRRDEPDYPLEALREAVVNAVVHRDYSIQGEAIRIFYYTDHIEVHSPGLLLPGISLADLQQGKVRSKLRNPVLGTILRDFPGGYMERVGSGISFMIEQMRQLGRPAPQFKEQGEIVVTFSRTPLSDDSIVPSVNKIASSPAVYSVANSRTIQSDVFTPTNDVDVSKEERQQLALRYIHMHGSITNKQYRDITGASENTALRDLDALVEQGSLRAIGKRRARQYKLP